jgi:hypothetical protein
MDVHLLLQPVHLRLGAGPGLEVLSSTSKVDAIFLTLWFLASSSAHMM